MAWERLTQHHHRHVETGRHVKLSGGFYKCWLDSGFIIGQCANKTEISSLLRKKLPQDQTVEEWLNNYNKEKQ